MYLPKRKQQIQYICNNIDLHDKLNTNALKKHCSKVQIIPGTIIDNIICSLFIDIHGGMLWLMTKTGQTEQVDLNSLNGLTPSAAKESLALRGSSLNYGHFSSMFLNAEPSAGIRRMSSP